MRLLSLVLAATLAPACLAPACLAQTPAPEPNNPNTFAQSDAARIVLEVRKKLLGLTDYDVFDSLSFGIRGRTIILNGFASRPTLKDDAQRAVKSISGVETVENQIKVLPFSPNDDNIRVGVYRRIYGQPALRKYTSAPPGFGAFPSIARAAGGITADPPLGYHAIHIIVENGHVTLKGVVDSEADATIAYVQANSTPGAFSVDNELIVARAPAKEK
jgi:hyperosmotically inducible protein